MATKATVITEAAIEAAIEIAAEVLVAIITSSAPLKETTISTPATSHALSCPEILSAIGKHVSPFESHPNRNDDDQDNALSYLKVRDNRSFNFSYRPKLLIQCTQVSKLWRQVFMPILWHVYEPLSMDHVPRERLMEHQDLCRILHLRSFWHLPKFLTDLKTHPRFRFLNELVVASSMNSKVVSWLLAHNLRLKKLSMFDLTYQLMPSMMEHADQLTTEAVAADPITTAGASTEAAAAAPATANNINASSINSVNGNKNKITPFEPLAHLAPTLEELHLRGLSFKDQELWLLLRPLAGRLRSLSLCNISGQLSDIGLDSLIFENLTSLTLGLRKSLRPCLERYILGRCPLLEDLVIEFVINSTDGNDGGTYPLDSMIYLLSGTEEVESKKEREKREKEGRQKIKQGTRPQLSSLKICDHPKDPAMKNQIANNWKILKMVRACSRENEDDERQYYRSNVGAPLTGRIRAKDDSSKHLNIHVQGDGDVNNGNSSTIRVDEEMDLKFQKGLGNRQNSLRELEVCLWVLDTEARKAIEAHKQTLQVLKIIILGCAERQWSPLLPGGSENMGNEWISIVLERQGRELEKLVQNCRRLRKLYFWDLNMDADVSVVVEDILKKREDDNNKTNNIKEGEAEGEGNIGTIEDAKEALIGGRAVTTGGNGDGDGDGDDSDRKCNASNIAWDNPCLESLTIRAREREIVYKNHLVNEDERRFTTSILSATATKATSTTAASALPEPKVPKEIEWIMPKQEIDSTFGDGISTLLGHQWSVSELFNGAYGDSEDEAGEGSGSRNNDEDGDMMQRFLTHVSYCPRLNNIQLGQLRLRRQY
ncbi:hypothetical protein BCR41DRAFT_356448, partial [Lobosporangium transversale]